jgi:hypothetical protein
LLQDSSLHQNQPSQERNYFLNIREQTFLQEAFQLIRTLPITFNNEPIPLILYKFILYSVNFWIKIIPHPHNEESKYTFESLSEGSDYFANIISQFQNLNKSDKIFLDDSPPDSADQQIASTSIN